MPTNIIQLTNYIELTNILDSIDIMKIPTTSWNDPVLLVTIIGSVLTFLITCFIAYTGHKAYKVYQEQVEQEKIQKIIELNYKIQALRQEFDKNPQRCGNDNPFECEHCRQYYENIVCFLTQGTIIYYQILDMEKLKSIYHSLFDELFITIMSSYMLVLHNDFFIKETEHIFEKYRNELFIRDKRLETEYYFLQKKHQSQQKAKRSR